MEVEGSWKGRLWYLYFIWIIVMINTIINFKEIELETKTDWLYFILFILATGLWVYGTIVLIKKFKDTFSQNK
jgi:surface polysaccharide O-acyltransferase-like enzyme|tara:strand:+ start:118737 stop:118955 length:219 start_codon:yes stop_codon:yes gene_type:complete